MPAIVFKEWLPDLPAMGNPGLIRANNVLPREDGYTPFLPLNASGGVITVNGVSGAFISSGVTKGSTRVYATAGDYYVGAVGGAFATRGAAGSTGDNFAQFDDMVIGVAPDHFPMKHTVGSASAFTLLATSGVAPIAGVIGIVNRFVVLGSLDTAGARPTEIQWSGIDQPESWPTPNSTTAIAQQAGSQIFPTIYGEIMAIHGSDQHAIVLQQTGITRMTYAGPPVVFQFDLIDASRGCFLPDASIQVGRLVYFISQEGFFRTDGVTVEPIGSGKINRYFWSTVYTPLPNISIGYETYNGLIYFAYASVAPSGGVGRNKLLIFNPATMQWTQADQQLSIIIGTSDYAGTAQAPLLAFSSISAGAVAVSRFNATAGSATFETGEIEINEAGRGYVDGVKANVESSGTAPAISMRVGYRDDLGTAPTYTATTAAFARTGVANFRVDAKYARFETQIVGNFTKATGIEVDAQPSSHA